MKTSARERAKRRPRHEDNSLADEEVVGVIGLGYVGLPIAVEFGKQMKTVGFELSARKIASYARHHDPTGEVSDAQLRAATKLKLTTDVAALRSADFIIVAVPTPVDDAHLPNFAPIVSACRSDLPGDSRSTYNLETAPGLIES